MSNKIVVNLVVTQTNINISVVISEVNLVGGNTKEWWVDTRATRHVSGTFCDKGRKCENDTNFPLGFLEVFICGESSPKFIMYRKQRLMVL